MDCRWTVALLVLSGLPACTQPPPSKAPLEETAVAGPLDGGEKSFLVVGYSTSYAWPDMLQEMLDRHAGGERVYHMLNAVVGGPCTFPIKEIFHAQRPLFSAYGPGISASVADLEPSTIVTAVRTAP